MNININLVRKQGDLFDLFIRNNSIIEQYHEDAPGGGHLFEYRFDPKSNRLFEIDPEVDKVDFVHFHVSYKPCTDVYYAVSHIRNDSTVDIDIMAYDLANERSNLLCTFNETLTVLTGRKRVNVFVLSRTQLIVQTEEVAYGDTTSLMGTIAFSQVLYDTDAEEPIPVVEENFINNGIHSIIPLNETEVVVKTGFSFLEDSRLSYGSEKEALIESVYITTLSKLTADLSLKLTNIDMELLQSTYFEQFILKPEVKDDFVFYNVINVEKHESTCVFYNYVTKEKTVAVNTDIDMDDLRIAHIVANTPYVRRYMDSGCEFVNLVTAENDISFYDEAFIEVCGELFITCRRHGKRSHLRVFRYPHMDIVLEERCNYTAGIFSGNDYYLYIE